MIMFAELYQTVTHHKEQTEISLSGKEKTTKGMAVMLCASVVTDHGFFRLKLC